MYLTLRSPGSTAAGHRAAEALAGYRWSWIKSREEVQISCASCHWQKQSQSTDLAGSHNMFPVDSKNLSC
ncbi:hypothetical protein E3U32_13825 [Lelliottia nimipressuralis]|nr:hypothetical protein E3U32_13825 [Lelliottia nimipressuralis]